MHCGKLSHALGKFDDAISCRGEYFLAPIDQHVQVDVDVINETDAIVLIRPGTRIGILNFININNETADAPLLQDEYGIFAEFNPGRSEEHTSELQSLMRNSYAVLCLKTKKSYKISYTSIITKKTYH